MGKVWVVGQRLMKDNWKEIMRVFNVMIKSVSLYRVEIWRWKKYEYLGSLQKRYIKCTLKLYRNTPDYIVRGKTKNRMIVSDTRIKKAKYEKTQEQL